MKRRSPGIPRAFAAMGIVLAQAGCFDPQPEPTCKVESTRPLGDGEKVAGHDPVALLEQVAGHWSGNLAWRTGEATTITVDVPAGQMPPYTAYLFCNSSGHGTRVGQVFTDFAATVSTADGALAGATTLFARMRFPIDGTVARDTPELSPFSPALGPPVSAIVDVSRYGDWRIVLNLTWFTPPVIPSGGRVIFSGTLSGGTAMTADQIDLGQFSLRATTGG